MAALHSALKYLAPVTFSEIPTSPDELDAYIDDLFQQCQLIVDSVPSSAPENGSSTPQSRSTQSLNSGTTDSSLDIPDYAALRKEWGKPIKLSAKENPLGISVFKAGGKDGKGAWFARTSIHEGFGFARLKRAFEREFPESLAVEGGPGEGNVRGIGAEQRVEEISVPNKGKIEVYRLTAQFPGPTTPRDFVTLLVTSSNALKQGTPGEMSDFAPRHYMIVSKPCDHPETQPRSGFIRGQYESVEFIRELPRRLKSSMSSRDLSSMGDRHDGRHSDDTAQKSFEEIDKSVPGDTASSVSRKRSKTVGVTEEMKRRHDSDDLLDLEKNPVEWIMITRSDPGGSVPRFMVERGTPSNICLDAQKFLNWAGELDDEAIESRTPTGRPKSHQRDSFSTLETNGRLAGIREEDTGGLLRTTDSKSIDNPTAITHQEDLPPTGIINSVTGALSAYAPKILTDHLPVTSRETASTDFKAEEEAGIEDDGEDDARSTISTASFASADSHFDEDGSRSISSKSLPESAGKGDVTQHERELAKLNKQREVLEAKFAAARAKVAKDNQKDSEKEQQALKRAEEKHERELKKQHERYEKAVAKLEQKKIRESQKLEERKRKQADKDEKSRLTRERDEARAELELLKNEQQLWQNQIGELQKENTSLSARVGRLEEQLQKQGLLSDRSSEDRIGFAANSSNPHSRSSSMVDVKKSNKS